MLESIECLTYPDVVSHLDGTSGRSASGKIGEHLGSCPKCRTVLITMRALIEDATAEEITLLDRIESQFPRLRKLPS